MGTSVTSSSTISTVTGYKAVGVIQLGWNGDVSLPGFEYSVGNNSGSAITGRKVWDPTESADEINSGDVNISFAANPSGGTNGDVLTVEGGATGPLIYTGVTYGPISQVRIRAAVMYGYSIMNWKQIAAKFFKAGALIETITYDAIGVDTSNQDDPVEAEQILYITPTNNDNDQVVISAVANIELEYTDIPSPTAIFGQIFVFAN
jgi:hypothetical protein